MRVSVRDQLRQKPVVPLQNHRPCPVHHFHRLLQRHPVQLHETRHDERCAPVHPLEAMHQGGTRTLPVCAHRRRHILEVCLQKRVRCFVGCLHLDVRHTRAVVRARARAALPGCQVDHLRHAQSFQRLNIPRCLAVRQVQVFRDARRLAERFAAVVRLQRSAAQLCNVCGDFCLRKEGRRGCSSVGWCRVRLCGNLRRHLHLLVRLLVVRRAAASARTRRRLRRILLHRLSVRGRLRRRCTTHGVAAAAACVVRAVRRRRRRRRLLIRRSCRHRRRCGAVRHSLGRPRLPPLLDLAGRCGGGLARGDAAAVPPRFAVQPVYLAPALENLSLLAPSAGDPCFELAQAVHVALHAVALVHAAEVSVAEGIVGGCVLLRTHVDPLLLGSRAVHHRVNHSPWWTPFSLSPPVASLCSQHARQ
eukprot:Rhum_TRINITY_DN2796_c0_g2::Rhum_TRINITY_DN2796_c0_g2_i1::g.8020::m.8020